MFRYKWKNLTALVSVATARVTNIIENVTTISITKACKSDPDGVVVPKCLIGCNNKRNVKAAQVAPLSCAAPYNGTYQSNPI